MDNSIVDIDFRYNGNGELEVLEEPIDPHIYPDINDGSSG